MTEAEVTVEQIAPGAWRWRCADCDIEGKTDHQREIWAQQWRAIHLKLNHGIIVDWPVDPDRTFGLRLTAQEIDDLTGVIEEWQIEGFAYPEGVMYDLTNPGGRVRMWASCGPTRGRTPVQCFTTGGNSSLERSWQG